MLNALALVLTLVPSRADSLQHFYAQADADALRSLCSEAVSREEDLLCRYRLYPLTMDDTLLSNLSVTLHDGSAREMALLAGLWGYRATSGSILNKARCGRRASRLLSEASAADPNEPFVLLIEGQSLLFRPKIFGGNDHRALEVFRQLQRTLEQESHDTIAAMEADLWVWFALHRIGDPAALAVRQAIEELNPPPLYADFLANPPS
jgi:hypothetical protein